MYTVLVLAIKANARLKMLALVLLLGALVEAAREAFQSEKENKSGAFLCFRVAIPKRCLVLTKQMVKGKMVVKVGGKLLFRKGRKTEY